MKFVDDDDDDDDDFSSVYVESVAEICYTSLQQSC